MGTQLSYVDPEKLKMRQEVQKTVHPSNVDERNLLTKSEPEVTTRRSDIKEEMFPKNSSDIQPSDGDREVLLMKEQHSVYEKQPRKMNEIPDDVSPPVVTQDTEKQPRKMNEVPDDVSPPVLTQDTEKQPRRKDSVQPLDVDQQRPPPREAQDGAQLLEVIHHEEPEATLQSPGGKREISEREGKTPKVGVGVQLSSIVPPGVIVEQQPRKKIDKPLDDVQHADPVENRLPRKRNSKDLNGTHSPDIIQE